MISVGQALGAATVAEGVETAEQGAFLRRVGCEFAQGYFFSRPVPPAELTAMLGSEAVPSLH